MIRAFAVLDSWFDTDEKFHVHATSPDDQTMYHVISEIVYANKYILSMIEDGCQEALRNAKLANWNSLINDYLIEELKPEDPAVLHFFNRYQKIAHAVENPLKDLRTELRDQLNQCLCNLELLRNGEGASFSARLSDAHSKKINAYQWMQLIALHTWQRISQLKRMEEHYQLHAEPDGNK